MKATKLLILLSLVGVLFCLSPVLAQDRMYVIDLSITDTVYMSGSTPYSGVSPFTVNYQNVTGLPQDDQEYIDFTKLKPSGSTWGFQLITAEPLYDTDVSGTTIEVTVKGSNNGTNWSDSSVLILKGTISDFLNRTVNWKPDFAAYQKIWISGGTIFQSASAIIACCSNSNDLPIFVVKEGKFDMPAKSASSGVSSFIATSIGAWPDCGDYMEVQSGNSLFATGDGTTPTTTGNGETLVATVTKSFEGYEARAAKFVTIAAQTVWYRILNRKP